ncbi:MAG: HAMP domain-containing histidine kinase, partial [Verrucomicrobiae bacterium]|nr:HAMP domain-containing histidine kinase [Verrucomicrobiae bacterium]
RRPAKPLTPVATTEPEQSPSSTLAETAEMRKKEDLAMASSAPAAAPAPAPLEKQEAKLVAQQKVAVDEDRYRNRSVQSRRPQEGASEFAVNEVVQPQPTTAPSAAPAAQAGRLATTPTDNNLARARNVRPLGQLEELQGDAQIGRFAEAANIALADNPNRQAWSTLAVNTGQLREVITDGPEGAISRFVSEGLQILLWRRDPAAPGLVFWVQLDLEEVKRDLTEIIRETGQRMGPSEVSLALLDASGQVVAQTAEGFESDWRKPFVAAEVGEMLPHWEVAAYLIDPRAVARSAHAARLMIWMLVPVLLTAIGVGSVLIIRDIGREMAFARQKTDFVSNVSHELKTPLTSIRMFSDILSQKPGISDGKRMEYSGIISREAARLSRLINNLLDFSRMERGEKRYRTETIDAGELARETVENYRHQIESDGYALDLADGLSGTKTWISGDRDALSQVLLNLLSNAEKYGGDAREILVETRRNRDTVEISVLDRGPGINRKHATKIFEKFYRADDSLSSGIEGSGLGLTLARQIARSHGGDVEFSARPDGGSRFTLRLPIARTPSESPPLVATP